MNEIRAAPDADRRPKLVSAKPNEVDAGPDHYFGRQVETDAPLFFIA